MLLVANRLLLSLVHEDGPTYSTRSRASIVDHRHNEVKRSGPPPASLNPREATSSRLKTVHETCPERRRTRIGEAIGGCPPSATIRSGNDARRMPPSNSPENLHLITIHFRSNLKDSGYGPLNRFLQSRLRLNHSATPGVEAPTSQSFRRKSSCKLTSNQSFLMH